MIWCVLHISIAVSSSSIPFPCVIHHRPYHYPSSSIYILSFQVCIKVGKEYCQSELFRQFETPSSHVRPLTDLGVNTLHGGVPVGLGLGDTVSVSCSCTQFVSLSRSDLRRAFPSVWLGQFRPISLTLTLARLVVAENRMKESKISRSSHLNSLVPSLCQTHAVWFFDLAIFAE